MKYNTFKNEKLFDSLAWSVLIASSKLTSMVLFEFFVKEDGKTNEGISSPLYPALTDDDPMSTTNIDSSDMFNIDNAVSTIKNIDVGRPTHFETVSELCI